MDQNEQRRAPRFKAALCVQIAGVDAEPVVRKGDLSATGMFIEINREVGRLGSLQRLILAEENGWNRVNVLAQIVRVATVEDFWRGRSIAGVALHFLFEEEEGPPGSAPRSRPANESEGLARLLRALMEQAAKKSGVAVNWRGTVDAGAGPSAASLHDVNVRGVVLETDRAIARGQTIKIELPGPSGAESITLEGQVDDCITEDDHFRARVVFNPPPAEEDADSEPPPSGMGETMGAAFSSLLEAVSQMRSTPMRREEKHFAGELARVSLVSVLTLCQLEQVTGVMTLDDGAGKRVRVFLRRGGVVDVEGSVPDPRQALGAALAFTRGTFSVEFIEVDRKSRVALSTTALVLDLLREQDERSRRP